MRKVLSIVCLFFIVGGLWVSSVPATVSRAIDDPASGVAGNAQYYPESTVLYASIVIDEAYVQSLNDVLRTFTMIGNDFGVPNVTIEQAITLGTGVNAQRALEWLGETASIGAATGEVSDDGALDFVRVVIDIEDREAAQQFLEDTVNITGTDDGFYPLEEGVSLRLLDDKIVINAEDSPGFPDTGIAVDGAKLADNADYQQALANMTASNYNILVYATPNLAVEALGAAGSLPAAAAAFGAPQMYGATIIDGNVFVIDGVILPVEGLAPMGISGVDADFARYIPSDTSASVQAQDLSALYYGILDFAEAASQPGEFQDPRPMIEAGLAELGIDLQADILDWTTGDYAFFMRGDIARVVEQTLTYGYKYDETFDLGMVIEATDPATAQRFAGKLSALVERAANDEDRVTAMTTEAVGLTVTSVQVQIPLTDIAPDFPEERSLNVEFLIGSNDEVFFVATRRAVEQILKGGTSIMDTPTYQTTSGYFLPDASSIWYTNGEGVMLTTVANPIVVLALLGPSIGEVFTEIVDSLGDGTPAPTLTPSPTPTPTPTPTPDPAEVEMIMEPLNALIDVFHSSFITSAVTDDGVTQVRLGLILNLTAR